MARRALNVGHQASRSPTLSRYSNLYLTFLADKDPPPRDCRGHHHTAAAPCPECQQLIDYCTSRIARCPREAEKTFYSVCPHPCYRPKQRERIREVMRWSGPHMLLVHPTVVVRHLVASPPWQRPARVRC